MLSVKQLMSSVTRHVKASYQVQTEEEFHAKVMGGDKPVAVKFTADWCGPCKMLSPRLDAAIAQAEDEVDLAVVDIDDLADIAMEHDVHAIPTVIGVKNGQIVDKFLGWKDEDQLASFENKIGDYRILQRSFWQQPV